MKNIRKTLVFIFALAYSSSFCQIYPGEGLIRMDSCTFESPCTLIRIDTNQTGNIWQIGTPEKPVFSSTYSAPNAIVTDLDSSYPAMNDSWFDLIINIWDMGLPNPVITFRHKYETDSLHDGGYLEISYDKGITWKNVINDTSVVWMSYDYGTPNREGFYSSTDTIQGGIPAFSGTSDGWQYSRLQWLWFIPVKEETDTPTDTILLRFHFRSDSINSHKAGWMIDNIAVYNTLVSGIPEYRNNNGNLNIHPNPANDKIFISIPGNFQAECMFIFNSMGQCVHTELFPSGNIDVSAFPAGLYNIVVQDHEKQLCRGTFIKK